MDLSSRTARIKAITKAFIWFYNETRGNNLSDSALKLYADAMNRKLDEILDSERLATIDEVIPLAAKIVVTDDEIRSLLAGEEGDAAHA